MHFCFSLLDLSYLTSKESKIIERCGRSTQLPADGFHRYFRELNVNLKVKFFFLNNYWVVSKLSVQITPKGAAVFRFEQSISIEKMKVQRDFRFSLGVDEGFGCWVEMRGIESN